jgi:nicotinate-nucleotide adenylyltransferase
VVACNQIQLRSKNKPGSRFADDSQINGPLPAKGIGLAAFRRPPQGGPLVKIGILGGSFDPVHFGHLMAAQDAFEQHQLDRLILVPAAQTPLKPSAVQSSAKDRLAMLRAATEWDHRFEVSDYELQRGGISYSIDSARHFRALFPQDHLYWIIGGDQLPQLHLWKDIAELAQLMEFIFLERPGYPAKAPRVEIPGLRLHRCDGHLLAINSTELRERTRRGLSLDYFVPHKAIVYIKDNHLYRDPA